MQIYSNLVDDFDPDHILIQSGMKVLPISQLQPKLSESERMLSKFQRKDLNEG